MNIDGIEFRPHDNIILSKLGWNTLIKNIIDTVNSCHIPQKDVFLFFRAYFVLDREGLEKDEECTWLRNIMHKPFFSVPVLVHRKDEGKHSDYRNYDLQVYIGSHEKEFELTLDILTEQYAKRKGIDLTGDVYSFHSQGFYDGRLSAMGSLPDEKPEGMTLFYLNRARFFSENSCVAENTGALGAHKIKVGCWYDNRYNSEAEIMRSFKSRDFFSLIDTDADKLSEYDIQLTGWMTYHAGCALYRKSYMQNEFSDIICKAANPIERKLKYIKCFDMIPSYSDAMYLAPESDNLRRIKDSYPYGYKGKPKNINTSYRWEFRSKDCLPFKNSLGYTLFKPVDSEFCVKSIGGNVLIMDDYDIMPEEWTYFTTLKINGNRCEAPLSEGFDCVELEKLLGSEKFEKLLNEGSPSPLYVTQTIKGKPEVSEKITKYGNPVAIKVETSVTEDGTRIRLGHLMMEEKASDNVFEEVFYRKNAAGVYTRINDKGICVPGESRKFLYTYLDDLSMRLSLDASEYGKADVLGLFLGKKFTKVEGLSSLYPVYGEPPSGEREKEHKRKKLWKNFVYTPGEKK